MKKISFAVLLVCFVFSMFAVRNADIDFNRGPKPYVTEPSPEQQTISELNRDSDYLVYAYNVWDVSGEYPAGLMSFVLNNPGEFVEYIAETTTPEMMVAATYVEDTIYALEFYTGDLYTISEEGVFTNIGGNGVGGDAIAYDPTTGILYEADATDLYEIDMETGNATLVGAIGNYSLIIAMMCDNEGNLFAIDMNDDNLYAIDKITGAGEIVGPLGIDINFAQDMDYDRDDGVCYLAAIGHQLSSRLCTINLETGNAGYIGLIDNGMEITGLAIPYSQNETGTLDGVVTLNDGDGNVEDVSISVGNFNTSPLSNGYFSIELETGIYDVNFSLQGYWNETINDVTIEVNETSTISATLNSYGEGTIIYGGEISGIWTLDDAPYLISGDVIIPDGETLIIEPGVIVEFQGHFRFSVLGRLLAVGTQEQMIKFTPVNTEVGWFGIRFIDTPHTNDESQIIFAEIEYGNAENGTAPFEGSGGGIAIINYDNVLISDCDIHHNRADTFLLSPGGGGIVLKNSDATITRNKIHHNSASIGGGIFIHDESNPIISYNDIHHNYALWDGGGIEIYHGGTPEIFNNNILYNTADEAGGGLDFYTDCTPNLTNNVIWGNSAPYGNQMFLYTNDVEPNLYYNNIQGGMADIEFNDGVTFTGDYENNIDEFPLFVDLAIYDYHLQEASPCIDAGDPDFPLDPDESRADIGAHYFGEGLYHEDETIPTNNIELSNFPNPFNPTTRISFELNKEVHEDISLIIYNLKGQKVKTFDDISISNKRGSIVWGGDDDSGYSVTSGVYLYQLKGKKILQSKKMMLLK